MTLLEALTHDLAVQACRRFAEAAPFLDVVMEARRSVRSKGTDVIRIRLPSDFKILDTVPMVTK